MMNTGLNDMLLVAVNGKTYFLAFKDFYICVVMLIRTRY